MTEFGRPDDEWDSLVAAGKGFLRERAEMKRDTSYTEMNTILAHRAPRV